MLVLKYPWLKLIDDDDEDSTHPKTEIEHGLECDPLPVRCSLRRNELALN